MAWLHLEQRLSLPRDIIDDAAAGGHVHMLIWLYDRGCELTSETSRRAAGNGHLNAINCLTLDACATSTPAQLRLRAAASNWFSGCGRVAYP
jgi:hypothetical protein